jgi:hypothetical protein
VWVLSRHFFRLSKSVLVIMEERLIATLQRSSRWAGGWAGILHINVLVITAWSRDSWVSSPVVECHGAQRSVGVVLEDSLLEG